MSSYCVSGNIPRSLGDALRNWSMSSIIWETSIFASWQNYYFSIMNLPIIFTESALMSSYCVSGNIPRSLGDVVRNWSMRSIIWEVSIFLRDKINTDGSGASRSPVHELIMDFLRNVFQKIMILVKFFLVCVRKFLKNDFFGQILLVLWKKFSQKTTFLVKFFLFCGRNFLKKSLIWSNSSCFVGEVFSKKLFFGQVLLVLREKFSQKITVSETQRPGMGGVDFSSSSGRRVGSGRRMFLTFKSSFNAG